MNVALSYTDMHRLLPLLLLTACTRPTRPESTAWDYVVTPSPDLSALDATVCFRGPPPRRLAPGVRRFAAFIREAALVRGATRTALHPDAAGLRLDDPRPGDCVAYTIDLQAAANAGRWQDAARVPGGDLVASPDLWLLRPSPLPDAVEATLRLRATPDLALAAPWPADGDGWRLARGAFDLEATTAFGHFRPERLAVPGGVLDVVRLGDTRRLPEGVPERWVERSARAVAQLYGGLPAPHVEVLLVPAPGSGVPFGMAQRGGGAEVVLLIGADSRPEDIEGAWVGPHEMAHLGQPAMRRADAWLFEGLATYYTYLLMGRVGMLTPAQAWQELHDGFGRGRSTGTGRALRDESAEMGRTHAYWRVYWAGAAFALDADVTLRRRTAGRWSLDRVLDQIAHCCARDQRLWTAKELLARMDAVLGEPFFTPLADRYLAMVGFPDVTPSYHALGLLPVDGRLELDSDPGPSALRAALLSPTP